MKFVSWKEKKAVAAGLKAIYGADTIELAEASLDFDEGEYPHVVKSWRNNWEGLTVFFNYSRDIRTAIYTTNAIEFLILLKSIGNRR